MLSDTKTALIIAPHPDDEILGCGGTIARMVAEGVSVHIVIMTKGQPPIFTAEQTENVRNEAMASHACLGVAGTHWLDLPAAGLDATPISRINAALLPVVEMVKPDTLFIPFFGDIHLDHQMAFMSALVCARPRHGDVPQRIYAYETLSETYWNAPGIAPAFTPNVFVDIDGYVETKLRAFELYASQVKPFPDERSFRTIEALATLRGSNVYRQSAEAFMLVRQIC